MTLIRCSNESAAKPYIASGATAGLSGHVTRDLAPFANIGLPSIGGSNGRTATALPF